MKLETQKKCNENSLVLKRSIGDTECPEEEKKAQAKKLNLNRTIHRRSVELINAELNTPKR